MGWKIVHLSRPCKIKVKDENLLIHFYDDNQKTKITLKDTDFLLFDNSSFSITGESLAMLARCNVATLFVDKEFHPCAIMSPYCQHSTMREIVEFQISTPEDFRQTIWKKIVTCKVKNQAEVLLYFKNPANKALFHLAEKIEPYDKNQDEAQAARIYWKSLFNQKGFKRDQKSEDMLNSMLNYSYAIIRACMARCVSAGGMMPVLGIWHKNRYNAFALVDDLMEVFRPLCDLHVKLLRETKHKSEHKLTLDIKRDLAVILTLECVKFKGGLYTVSNAIESFAKEYKKVMMSGEVDALAFPLIDFEFFKYECL
jgi:CRISPR-associated protein Cas1